MMWDPMGGWEFLCYWITLLNKRMLGLEMLNPKAQTLNPKPKALKKSQVRRATGATTRKLSKPTSRRVREEVWGVGSRVEGLGCRV